MLTTENFASTQWCPLARPLVFAASPAGNTTAMTAANREVNTGEVFAASTCIGSRCMAWRWHDTSPVKQSPGEYGPEGEAWQTDEGLETVIGQPEPPRPSNVPAGATWEPLSKDADGNWKGGIWTDSQEYVDALNKAAQERRRGFCGAFGKVDHA